MDVVIGRVVLIHIKDEVTRPEGRIDILQIRPLARLGDYDYTRVDWIFEMVIPTEAQEMLEGWREQSSKIAVIEIDETFP